MKVSVIIPVYNQEELLKRAVESIPKRDDIEIIVINDGSTDNTHETIKDLDVVKIEYKENKGVSYALNRGLEVATGEYIVLLGSDDYFYTDKFLEVMDYLNGADIVYFNLRQNDGVIWDVNPESARRVFCGSVKFMRREFIKGLKNREDLVDSEDWYFFQEILERKPIETTTGIVAKHYNFPREGSLTWNRTKTITIYTVVYNGYGKYLPKWIKNVKQASPTDILVMLGKNHGADLKFLKQENIRYIETSGNIIHNEALNNIKTGYVMFFDVDDILLPNAVEEIIKKEEDVVALKYIERYKSKETIKNSAIMTKGNFHTWKQISTPGYYAFRRILNGDIMYFDNVSTPKFPHLFKLANRGATMTHTNEVCAIYNRVREHPQKAIKERTKAIEERLKYYE